MSNTLPIQPDILEPYDVKSVQKGYNYWVKYFINKCSILFILKNLPDTLPAWAIQKQRITKGYSCIVDVKNPTRKGTKTGLYAPPQANAYGFDAYMVPNMVIYANPVLGSGSKLINNKDAVIIWNTPMDKHQGGGSIILNVIKRYARMLAELESTFANVLTRTRGSLMAQAMNNTAAKSAKKVMNNMSEGNPEVIVNSAFSFDTIKFFDFEGETSYTGFTEARDYLINCFWNEIGLQTLEEKKEHMITAEIEYDSDILQNAVDIMFMELLDGIERVNETFGTNIEVVKNPTLFPEGGHKDEREDIPQDEDDVQGDIIE